MKILLTSFSFAPNVGGIETASLIFAREFTELGHEVVVVTNTARTGNPEFFHVVRQPSFHKLLHLVRQADVIFQNNISINLLAPALLTTKPIFITTQTWINHTGASRAQQFMRRAIMLRCHNIAISRAIAKTLPVKSELIYNPYDAEEFLMHRNSPKTRDLVYMGRLNMDKGVDILIRAMGVLKRRGICPNLTVIGPDVHLTPFQGIAVEENVTDQVTFSGLLTDTRSAVVAQHKIMVVPSRWNEPFGIVAIEGIAAGCAIIGSSGGGLPEAIGPCGMLFPNEDYEALADCIQKMLPDPTAYAAQGIAHLAQFGPRVVAKRYLKMFSR